MKLSKIRPAIGRDNVYFHKIFRYLAITTFILFFCFTFIISALIIRRYSQEIVSGSLQNMDASVTASDSALNGLYSYCYFLANNNAAVNDILYADRFSSELSIQFSSLKDDFLNYCSRSKFLSKIFKINVKNFREIFPDFTHRKRGSDFITVPFLSSGSHALRLPSAFPFSVPCLEYTLSVLQQSNLTPHISGLYALPSN